MEHNKQQNIHRESAIAKHSEAVLQQEAAGYVSQFARTNTGPQLRAPAEKCETYRKASKSRKLFSGTVLHAKAKKRDNLGKRRETHTATHMGRPRKARDMQIRGEGSSLLARSPTSCRRGLQKHATARQPSWTEVSAEWTLSLQHETAEGHARVRGVCTLCRTLSGTLIRQIWESIFMPTARAALRHTRR